MSVNLSNAFTQQFSSTVQLLLQEKGPKLRPYVMVGNYVGKQASPVNQFGPVSMNQITTRLAPKTRTDASVTRRWVFPSDFTLNQQIDSFDQLKTIVDPKSAYAENAAMTVGRQIDALIIAAATGSSKVGESGGSTETFSTTDWQISESFGASAAVGLTVDKLIEARRLMVAANVDLDMDPAVLIIGPQQEADLLNQVQITSLDYNNRPVLVDGRVKQFLGFNVVVSNQLATSSTNRRCLAFVRSGMHLGIWNDIQSDAHQRNDIEGDPWELSTKLSAGSTRIEQGKVIDILSSEA